MTLNPTAEVFVPSSQTMKRLEDASTLSSDEKKGSANHTYSPPQLESLYIDLSGTRNDEEFSSNQARTVSRSLDYSNFDLPFFFHDMMSADSDDFSNYLTDRAEYLLGYAGTSPKHAIEVVDTILDTIFNLLRKEGPDYKKPLKLAAEMCDMDGDFLQMMLQQMVRLLDYLRNPVNQDLAYSVLFALMLNELHIGTCVAPPEDAPNFAQEACELFVKLLQDKRSISAAVFALEQCEIQLKFLCKPQQVETICTALRKLSGRFSSTDLYFKCIGLQKDLRQQAPYLCLKAHAMPVAQLNEEEARDFEEFLRESSEKSSHNQSRR